MTYPEPEQSRPLWVAFMLAVALMLIASLAFSADWITAPSYYTHKDGKRVQQYKKIEPPVHEPNLNQGGWSRSVIRGPDGSIDVYWRGNPRWTMRFRSW